MECMLCGGTADRDFSILNSHNNPEKGHAIILMLNNMKKLKHKWLTIFLKLPGLDLNLSLLGLKIVFSFP